MLIGLIERTPDHPQFRRTVAATDRQSNPGTVYLRPSTALQTAQAPPHRSRAFRHRMARRPQPPGAMTDRRIVIQAIPQPSAHPHPDHPGAASLTGHVATAEGRVTVNATKYPGSPYAQQTELDVSTNLDTMRGRAPW